VFTIPGGSVMNTQNFPLARNARKAAGPSIACVMALRPELIEGILVIYITLDLCYLAVTDMVDRDDAALPMLARPLGPFGIKRHGPLVVGKNIPQLITERAPPDNSKTRPMNPRI
jgi:hypothetical protein